MQTPLQDEDYESGRHDPPRPSFIGKSKKASIRSNSPGAMWPGPSSRRFGAVQQQMLADGLGQGNRIAIFPDAISGAAALFDLWYRAYTDRKLKDAIKKWSGGNHVQSYLDVFIERANIPPDMIITKDMIKHPEFAIRFAKAMAWHEAGEEFPLTDEQWRLAHSEAFNLPPPVALPTRAEAKTSLQTGSKKYKVASVFDKILGFFGLGSLGTWAGVKAGVDVSNDVASTASAMAADYGWTALTAFILVLWIVFRWLKNRQIEDVQAGRATPSGAEE